MSDPNDLGFRHLQSLYLKIAVISFLPLFQSRIRRMENSSDGDLIITWKSEPTYAERTFFDDEWSTASFEGNPFARVKHLVEDNPF